VIWEPSPFGGTLVLVAANLPQTEIHPCDLRALTPLHFFSTIIGSYRNDRNQNNLPLLLAPDGLLQSLCADLGGPCFVFQHYSGSTTTLDPGSTRLGGQYPYNDRPNDRPSEQIKQMKQRVSVLPS
jgi:hypothetical protein